MPDQLNTTSFAELLWQLLFSQTNVSESGNRKLILPNLYRFVFSILDTGRKGYLCEHDLFGLIQQFQTNDTASNNVVD